MNINSTQFAPVLPNLTPKDAYKKMLHGAVIVDVRTPEEIIHMGFDVSPIISIPLHEFESRIEELPKGTELIMACRVGVRSAKAGKILLSRGFSRVYNITGGILLWQKQGLPVNEPLSDSITEDKSDNTTRIYLDYNATTPIALPVKKIFIDALEEFANGSSMHEDGRRVLNAVEKSRGQIASLIHAKPHEILFTSGGSETNNMVFNIMNNLSLLPSRQIAAFAGRKTIITTQIEHPCVLESARYLESRGVTVHYLPVDSYGLIDMHRYQELLDASATTTDSAQKILLVSIMTANNEIGTIQDIELLSRMAHAAGALFHTDAVQAIGKIPVHVTETDIDYLTISGHKIYGPKGIGALYSKTGSPFFLLFAADIRNRGYAPAHTMVRQ